MIKYPSIIQLRGVVKNVIHTAQTRNEELPVITFKGTVKLHGTNASVVLYPDGELVAQSRNRVLELTSDNAGWAAFVHKNRQEFIDYLSSYSDNSVPVGIYGEWCGGSIQSGVALAKLDKMFVAFNVRFGDNDNGSWVDSFDLPKIDCVYSINDFQTWEITIDFNRPAEMQNKLIEITEAVEAECPVAKHFGVSGIGEGVVYKSTHPDYQGSDYIFKVKGEKHSVSKVKTLASVDVELMKSIGDFVDSVVTDNRVRQGIDVLREEGKEVSQKSTGDVLRWLFNDIIKEEADTMVASGLEIKMVGKEVSSKGRNIYFKLLDELEGM
jgi:hypothetical protein